MKLATTPIVALGLLAVAGASPTAFVLNTNQTIDMVNVATNADIPFNTTIFQSDSLARGPSGTLYSADPNGVLWNVTGAPIPVGPTLRVGIADLDYANGGLWGYSNASSELFFFDLTLSTVTYAATVLLPTNLVATGVAYHVPTGDIFLSGNSGFNSDLLFRVASSTTTAVLVGAMAHTDAFSTISDIDFGPNGSLYAVTWFHRHFLTVSTVTASTTLVSTGPHRDTTAMALDPTAVPAPAAALAFVLSALRRRRRS